MGLIFDVQRFCIHDGPGIRTTVFFKGCPLRCKWCSNPESQSMTTEFMFSAERCIAAAAARRPVRRMRRTLMSSFQRADVCTAENVQMLVLQKR